MWNPKVQECTFQGPGFYVKATPLPQKRPEQALQVQPKKRPRPKATPDASLSTSAESSVLRLVPRSKVRPRPTATPSASSSSAPTAAPSGSAWREQSPVSSARHDSPWPCAHCRQMPWMCSCHGGAGKTQEVILKAYADVCKEAGVWDRADAQQRDAEERAAALHPPAPDHPKSLWCCWRCRTMNSVHQLQCCVASCGEWRPLTQPWREDKGDWICSECGNHNWGMRRWCNWTACPTNDWRCVCGNHNRSNRKLCNRSVCSRPRPFGYE